MQCGAYSSRLSDLFSVYDLGSILDTAQIYHLCETTQRLVNVNVIPNKILRFVFYVCESH